MAEKAAVYTRISEDPRDTRKGVERQRELRSGAYRPRYAAMTAAAERGGITRIVAYGLSRLWRNRQERADAIDALRRLRVSIALVKGMRPRPAVRLVAWWQGCSERPTQWSPN